MNKIFDSIMTNAFSHVGNSGCSVKAGRLTSKKIIHQSDNGDVEIEFTKGLYLAGTKDRFQVFEAAGASDDGKKWTANWIQRGDEVVIDNVRDENYDPDIQLDVQ